MFQSKKFSRVFHDIESAINFAYFNDLIEVVEYRDDFSVITDTRRAHRVGVRLGSEISWGPWRGVYDGFENIRSVYRVRIDRKLDNAYQGIV